MMGKGWVFRGLFLFNIFVFLSGATALANPHYFKLENGVRVVLVQANTSKVVVLTRFNVGFLDESVKNGEAGISHFLEHLLAIRGTETFPSQHQVMEELNALQAQYNASTSYDRTIYFLFGDAKNLPGLIQLQSEQLARPTFNADSAEFRKIALEEMTLEKGAVSEESLRGQVSRATSVFESAVMAHAENERLAQLATGSVQEIRNYSPQTVREFYQDYYTGPNAVVVVAGGITDIPATLQLIKNSYNRLPDHQPPAAGLAKEELRPAKQQAVRVATVRAIGEKTRSLQINYPLRHTLEGEAAAQVLAKYLNRRGAGSTLERLFKEGYFVANGVATGVYTMRDLMFLGVSADLTVKGERNIAYVTEYLSNVFAEIAANGLPETLFDDIKTSVLKAEFQNENLLNLAERVAQTRFFHDVDQMQAPQTAVSNLSADDVKALATKLLEPRAELTVYTSNVKGSPNEIVSVEDYAEKYSEVLPTVKQKLSGSPIILDAEPNLFMHADESVLRTNRDEGNTSKILLITSSENTSSKAIIELKFLNAQDRLSAEVAMAAFLLEPEHSRFFSMAEEAKIDLEFGFNSEENTLKISIDSTAPVASHVVRFLLNKFRSYEPSGESLRAAKLRLIEQVREKPVNDVSHQAVDLGLALVNGQEPETDLKAKMKSIAGVDLKAVKKVLAVLRQHWGTQATFIGNWDRLSLETIQELIEAPFPESLESDDQTVKKNKPKTLPALAVAKTDVERVGVARLWPLDLVPYSKEYWALGVFSELVDRVLMETVRGQFKMAYTPLSSLNAIDKTRSVFLIFSDTSKQASSLAMGFSIALDEALHGELTETAFEAARGKVLMHLDQLSNGAQGVYNKHINGSNWDEMKKHVSEIKREELQSLAQAFFRNSTKLDVVATNNPGAYCDAVLTQTDATSSVVRGFYQNILPKLRTLTK